MLIPIDPPPLYKLDTGIHFVPSHLNVFPAVVPTSTGALYSQVVPSQVYTPFGAIVWYTIIPASEGVSVIPKLTRSPDVKRGKRNPLLEEFSSRTDLVLGVSVPMPTCAVVVVMLNNQTAKALNLFIGQNLKKQNSYSFPNLRRPGSS